MNRKEAPLGRIFDIQKFSLQDGPGIRTTVFLKGCPLRCPWCHSPESQSFHPELSWMESRCTGLTSCGQACVTACLQKAIKPDSRQERKGNAEKQFIHVDRSLCQRCGACTQD